MRHFAKARMATITVREAAVARKLDTFYLRLLMRLVSNRGFGLSSPAVDRRWGNPVTPRSHLHGRTDCQVKTRFPPSIQEPGLIRMERINNRMTWSETSFGIAPLCRVGNLFEPRFQVGHLPLA